MMQNKSAVDDDRVVIEITKTVTERTVETSDRTLLEAKLIVAVAVVAVIIGIGIGVGIGFAAFHC